MNAALTKACRAVAGMALLCLAAGCATQSKPLYGWDGYQSQVYEYLKSAGEADPQPQIAELETAEQKIQGRGAALPPGYNAHMAMLYAKAGQVDKSAERLTAEKTQFPESAPFMDFLLNTLSGKTKP